MISTTRGLEPAPPMVKHVRNCARPVAAEFVNEDDQGPAVKNFNRVLTRYFVVAEQDLQL
jgi:hypothetical protein